MFARALAPLADGAQHLVDERSRGANLGDDWPDLLEPVKEEHGDELATVAAGSP